MSKDLFEQYREEDIHTMVTMPLFHYKHLTAFYHNSDCPSPFNLMKHYIPSNRELFKKNKRWSELELTRKECREEQKEIESEIRVNETRRSLT